MKFEQGRGVIASYSDFLPVNDKTPIISLGEGDTPLIYCLELSKRVGRGCDVFCASTGNTSASAAAYAARAGISCVVILPAGKIASGKLLQAFAYGAKIVAIRGSFDDALRIVRELGEQSDFVIVNSINPDRIAGQKTAAFEIVDEIGDAPDYHLLPVGNAGNITACWAGYRGYHSHGRSRTLPVMLGFQVAGAAPIFHNLAGAARRHFCRTGERRNHCRLFQMLRFKRGCVFIQKNSGTEPDCLHGYRARIERSRCNYAAHEGIETGPGDRERCAARDRSLEESAFDTLASQAETMPFRISLSCFIIHS